MKIARRSRYKHGKENKFLSDGLQHTEPIGGLSFNYCARGGISGASMPLKVDKLITEKGISGASMPFMPEAPLPEAPEFKLPEAPLPEAPEGSDIHNAQSIIKPET